jgi:ABC-2 type transport system permease protein
VTRTLYVRQLRHHARLLVAIMLGLAAFEALLVWISASMNIGPEFHALLQMMLPPAMLRFVMDQFGFASFESAVAFGFKHPLVLLSGITFSIVAATIPAGERETGLLDLVLARPVPRAQYLAAHMLLVITGAVLIPAALLAGAIIGLALTHKLETVAWTTYAAPAAAYAPLLLLVGSYSLLFAAGASRRGVAVARAAGLTIVFFWYEVLASMWQRLAGYEWATIFYYYSPVQVLSGERGVRESTVLVALSLVLGAGALVRFGRQQL